VTENSARIDATMANLQEITGKINRGDGTLGKLVNDPKLHDELLATVDEIKATAAQAKEFVNNAEAMMDQIKSGQGPWEPSSTTRSPPKTSRPRSPTSAASRTSSPRARAPSAS